MPFPGTNRRGIRRAGPRSTASSSSMTVTSSPSASSLVASALPASPAACDHDVHGSSLAASGMLAGRSGRARGLRLCLDRERLARLLAISSRTPNPTSTPSRSRSAARCRKRTAARNVADARDEEDPNSPATPAICSGEDADAEYACSSLRTAKLLKNSLTTIPGLGHGQRLPGSGVGGGEHAVRQVGDGDDARDAATTLPPESTRKPNRRTMPQLNSVARRPWRAGTSCPARCARGRGPGQAGHRAQVDARVPAAR